MGGNRSRRRRLSGEQRGRPEPGEYVENSRPGGLVACAVLCALVVGCAREDAPAEPPPAFDDRGVVNEAWRIVKMATAHDVITLEVEVADLETASAVARELMAPLESRYAEALIYVYAAGEGEGGHVPAMRFQWTADGGIVAMEY